MRTVSLSPRTLHAAVSRGEAIRRAWSAKGFPDEWQATLIELARIPAVDRRMRERQRRERNGCPDAYGTPAPVSDLLYHLPGYVMDGWSIGPRPGWELAHCPSNAYQGLRRNLYASVLDLLYRVVRDPNDSDASLQLLRLWKLRIRSTPPHPSVPLAPVVEPSASRLVPTESPVA